MNRNFKTTQVQRTPFSGDENIFSLEEILRTFMRRKNMLLATMFLLMGLTTLIVFQLPREYTATVTLEIEPRTNNVLDTQAIFSGLPMDSETTLTEIEILKSFALHAEVVEELNLTQDPEFNSSLEPSLLSALSILLGEETETPEKKANRERVETATLLSEKITISQIGLSRAIIVSMLSRDPEKAALIANVMADKYLESQLEAKFQEIQRTSVWLNERLGDLEDRVQVSEQAVEAYRQRYGLFTIDGGSSATTEQMTRLNIEIIIARSERAQAQAKLDNIQTLLQRPGGTSTAGDVLANELIQTLKAQEAEVLRNIANLQERYGPKHPLMIQTLAEIKDLNAKVELEVSRIIGGLKSNVEVAEVREKTLLSELGKLEANLSVLNQREIQLRQLQREANTNKTLYQDFLTSFKTVAGQQGIQSSDARIVSAAVVPTVPSHPKTFLILAAALLLSGLSGTALIFLVELLDNTFRSTETVESMIGLNTLGIMPEIGNRKEIRSFISLWRKPVISRWKMDKKELQKISYYAKTAPTSSFAEALRNVAVGVSLADIDHPPKVVLVTSSEPREGKSMFAFSLAVIKAVSGKKTIVVDCDLRKPFIHEITDSTRSPGIVNYLKGDATLKDIIRKDKKSGLYYITAGDATNQSANLLGSEKFARLLADLKKQYDFIAVDSPPLMALTDSAILAQKVDGVIFAARWGWTRQNVVKESVKRLQKDRANILGIVLTRVNLKRQAFYGYGDSNYYYSGYSEYYTKQSPA